VVAALPLELPRPDERFDDRDDDCDLAAWDLLAMELLLGASAESGTASDARHVGPR